MISFFFFNGGRVVFCDGNFYKMGAQPVFFLFFRNVFFNVRFFPNFHNLFVCELAHLWKIGDISESYQFTLTFLFYGNLILYFFNLRFFCQPLFPSHFSVPIENVWVLKIIGLNKSIRPKISQTHLYLL